VNPALPVVTTLVCFFILHARLRVRSAPGIPHALIFFRGVKFLHNSGGSRREAAEVRLRSFRDRTHPCLGVGRAAGLCHPSFDCYGVPHVCAAHHQH
jgi:hypothetical protein